jgi:hypothetical protein
MKNILTMAFNHATILISPNPDEVFGRDNTAIVVPDAFSLLQTIGFSHFLHASMYTTNVFHG